MEGGSRVRLPTQANVLDVPSENADTASTRLHSKKAILVSGANQTMHELAGFLTRTIESKRRLKEVYYTTRDESTKADSKELVAATISAQKIAESLLSKCSKDRLARTALEDRKAELVLSMWSVGLPRRVRDYTEKQRKLGQEHLHKYEESLLEYIQGITREMSTWLNDIETLSSLPRPAREKERKE